MSPASLILLVNAHDVNWVNSIGRRNATGISVHLVNDVSKPRVAHTAH
jgi:hypothetical protein